MLREDDREGGYPLPVLGSSVVVVTAVTSRVHGDSQSIPSVPRVSTLREDTQAANTAQYVTRRLGPEGVFLLYHGFGNYMTVICTELRSSVFGSHGINALARLPFGSRYPARALEMRGEYNVTDISPSTIALTFHAGKIHGNIGARTEHPVIDIPVYATALMLYTPQGKINPVPSRRSRQIAELRQPRLSCHAVNCR